MSKYKEIFDENINRVEGLKILYVKLKEEEKRDSKSYRLTDLLRAATVFLHAAFEEYFRSILKEWLPIKASNETLKQIPIAINAGKHAEKLYLSDLANYRDKNCAEIISESVAEDLKLRSFNSEKDIRIWCGKAKIELGCCKDLEQIDHAVQRRHKIVHEADNKPKKEGEKGILAQIKPTDLEPWISAYKSLVDCIEEQIEKWKET